MPKQPHLPMSDAEREVLKVLWDGPPLGVKDVRTTDSIRTRMDSLDRGDVVAAV